MRLSKRFASSIAVLGFSLSGHYVSAQKVDVATTRASACKPSSALGALTLRAPQQSASLSLCEGHALTGAFAGSQHGTPLTLASTDFDGDGVPDLASGFGEGSGGSVTIYRGNIAALWPYGAAISNGPPPAFLPNPRSFSVPETPDFLVTGDFDADGHQDIVTAQRGSGSFYFLRGDGHGGFQKPKCIAVDGRITQLIAGEVNRADGLADLVVTVDAGSGAAAMVFESPSGAVKAQAEIFALPGSATAVALGKFTGGAMNDLAVASGSNMVMIEARDRKLSQSSEQRGSVPAAKVTMQALGFRVKALVAGDFTGTGPSVAALGDDGNVHIIEHAVTHSLFSAQVLSDLNSQPTFQVGRSGSGENPPASGASAALGTQQKLASRARAMVSDSNSSEWTERSTVSLPSGFSQAVPRLVAAHVSGSKQQDILVADSGNAKLHVLSMSNHSKGLQAQAVSGSSALTTPAAVTLAASLEATSAPVAVLPMRLNRHGLSGLVTLHANQVAPSITPHLATQTFVVTNTLDAPKDDAPAGSLRAAMNAAEAASGDNDGGTYEIDFNIPTSDPGYNPATGTFLIQPVSQSVPNAFNDFALPPINATVVIDGYTQPGASPNTLTSGSNAKLLIEINGAKATTPGGSGLVPFDDVGSTFRGLVFTGWLNPDISSSSSGSTASGAEGIEANGVGDFIEGNFFGTDPSGTTAKPNRIGIFGDNGPLFGSAPGNVVGGTTPQARNLISGNSNSGVLLLSTAYEMQVQGNWIGLDITGTKVLMNSFDGVGSNGSTVTFGGTLPNTGNVISGNGTNVDLNDLTDGGAASDSIVQGNLIGTDPTGTISLSQGYAYGVSILHGVTNELIGGTTPAARNVISGNNAGIYIFDNSFNNVVQGNLIGTDITGTKAIGNTNQGITIGGGTDVLPPAGNTVISGNVISGNLADGIEIAGTSASQGYPYGQVGNTILGNFIGTDVTGTNSIPNKGNGIYLSASATNNIIGGTITGSANVISNNTNNGILIDPGTGTGNVTIANTIQSNGGAGVRVVSGTGNRISENSIFDNHALGIDIDASGPGTNTHCNVTNTGANILQNYPVLTAGAGTIYISATATDPNGNTSEFSKAVQATKTGNVISLLGSFDGVASKTYSIEFFSSPNADSSGYGQGQTYLGSANITTDANCGGTIADPIDLTTSDVSVSLSASTTQFSIGPDSGQYVYTATVTNNGPATAHNVVVTDTLPAGLKVSSMYCNQAACQSPITTTLGTCTVSGQTITCNLGTLPVGATAAVNIPVQALSPGSVPNTVTVQATEVDPNLTNNTSTVNVTSIYISPFFDHFSVSSALAGSGDLPLTIYGEGFISQSTVKFDGTSLPVLGIVDNQNCPYFGDAQLCAGLQILVPASLLATAGSKTVEVDNPDPGDFNEPNEPTTGMFTVASACTYNVFSLLDSEVSADGTGLIADSVEVGTNIPSCTWTATSTVPWAAILDNAQSSGSGSVDVAFAPNPTTTTRSGSVTVAGQMYSFTQDAGTSSTCVYTLSPPAGTFDAAGGPGTFTANFNIPFLTGGCSAFVEAYPQNNSVQGQDDVQWITVSDKTGLLSDTGPVNFSVAPNSGPQRMGSIAVGGDVYTVTQNAPTCYFTLSATSIEAPVGGTAGTITVTPTPSSCSWTAVSSNSAQVSVTSGASGTGVGTVHYSVAVNNGGPITPAIMIGNAAATSVFTVNQASAYTCTFTISPNPKSIGINGTTDFFTLTASFPFCKWTAASNNPDSLDVTVKTSGMGSGAVYYRVGQNTSTASRTLTITAGCQTFTVNQDGTGKANNPTPAITALSPNTTTAGSAAFTLTITGTNFVSGATVTFNGVARATTYVSPTQLTAAILATDVANAGTPSVTVINPSPGGGTSNALVFTVAAANNPLPTLTSLSPSTAAAGSAGFTLTVTGTNFVAGSTINFNGSARATTYISSTQLTASILSGDVAVAGTPSVTVTNATPGGGTSNAVSFTITATNNPVPTLTSLLPNSTAAGSAGFTLTVTGTNFVTGSTVNFGGSARTTTYVSGTQLTAAILASDVVATGTPSVTVTSPTPGGGTSNAATFTVSAANIFLPTLTSLSPNTVVVGSAGFTLTVSGTNLINGSTVNFGGTARTTTYVSATQLTAAILASDVAVAGTPSVTVTNPAPSGGTSNAVTFTVSAAPTYTLSSSTPAQTVVPGGSATYSITATAQGGTFPGTITLIATGLPVGAMATFAPTTLSPSNTSATSILTIKAPLTKASLDRPSGWTLAAMTPIFGLLLMNRRRRRRLVTLALLFMALTAAIGLSGCGGGFGYSQSSAQSYAITVTGTSGTTQQSTTVNLTVNF